MAARRKVIITCAVTGAIHTPSMSAHLPVTPEEIAEAAIGAAMGSNVRVGLEDSLWGGPGTLAESNAEQVRKICQVLDGLSLEIATPNEAREMLQLKGGDNVAF